MGSGLRMGFPSPGPDGPCRARTGWVGYGAVHDFGVPQKAPAGVTCRAGPHSEPRTELGVVAALALSNKGSLISALALSPSLSSYT